MQEIIDSPYNVGDYAARLFQEGVRTVIRYDNIKNSSTFLSKCLTAAEYGKLVAAGLDVAVVFQQRGGAGGAIEDFGSGKGARDAKRALELAGTIGQPKGSAIYFAVDHDFARPAELVRIEQYFQEIHAALNGDFRVGVYGSGAVCAHLKAKELASLFWLPASMGWTGSRAFLASQQWTLFQKFQDLRAPFGNFDYDGNLANPAFADFGQFGAASAAPGRRPADSVAVFEVAARSGLRVRGGAGEQFDVLRSLPLGALVHGLGTEADWVQVDVNGDGVADGYMARQFLKPLSGGLPLPTPSAAPTTPYAVAQAELALGVKETPGRQDNPRIVLYHGSTKGGEASDETAWCSSFVNYCVEKAGMKGTDSKWARSWHDSGWGHDVTSSPQPGDIVVWSRKSPSVDGGHVGFFVGHDGKDRIRVLGGNQGNRVGITSYPADGTVGQTRYKLLSIRR